MKSLEEIVADNARAYQKYLDEKGQGTMPHRPSGASTKSPRPATKRGQVLLDDLRAIIPPGLWTPFREEQIAGSIAAVERAGAASTEATLPHRAEQDVTMTA
jgi:hypothetical protein